MSGIRSWLYRDGSWTPSETLPVTDRAIRYGMSVFETLGVRDGKPLFAEEHLALLEKSTRTLLSPVGSAGPSGPLPELPPDSRGMLRIYVTAGDGGPSDPVNAPRIFALFEPLSGELPEWQSAHLHHEPVSPFAHGAKTGNYWTQCAAQSTARATGFDHALIHDNEERLLSAAMGNLFFVHEDALCTPSLSLAVRPGVIREWVMEQETVREVELAAGQLPEVRELFLTNSRLGVIPLQLGTIGPGPVGCALRDRCRREKIIP